VVSQDSQPYGGAVVLHRSCANISLRFRYLALIVHVHPPRLNHEYRGFVFSAAVKLHRTRLTCHLCPLISCFHTHFQNPIPKPSSRLRVFCCCRCCSRSIRCCSARLCSATAITGVTSRSN